MRVPRTLEIRKRFKQVCTRAHKTRARDTYVTVIVTQCLC